MQQLSLSSFELVTTSLGFCTLRLRGEKETFHPGLGPMGEAELLHVQGQKLAQRALRAGPEGFAIWDVGLGAAANAIAAIEALSKCGAAADLHSFEVDLGAAEFAMENAEPLGYLMPYRETLRELLRHRFVKIGNIRWHLHLGDCSNLEITKGAGHPQALLYDPYSPKVNPQLWSLEHFSRLHSRVTQTPLPCTLTSYSRSSAVRVTLLLAGFHVGVGPVCGEKDQTTVAATDSSLIDIPLAGRWLDRVRRSTKGAPLREGIPGGPISTDDWNTLVAHPQFSGIHFTP